MRLTGRLKIIRDIRDLVNVSGSEVVRITLAAEDATMLADDLTWCEKSTERNYRALSVRGHMYEAD